MCGLGRSVRFELGTPTRVLDRAVKMNDAGNLGEIAPAVADRLFDQARWPGLAWRKA